MTQFGVAVASEHRLFVEGLQTLLRHALDRSFSLAETSDARPDLLVLLDGAKEGALARGAELARSGRLVILIDAPGDEEFVVAALRAGVRGVLESEAGLEQLLKAMRAVVEGQVWAPPRAVARALSLLSTMTDSACARSGAESRLTTREREIVGHTLGGLNNKEIAARMAIRTATVKAHLTSVFRKLSVRDRIQLVVLFQGSRPKSLAPFSTPPVGSPLGA